MSIRQINTQFYILLPNAECIRQEEKQRRRRTTSYPVSYLYRPATPWPIRHL